MAERTEAAAYLEGLCYGERVAAQSAAVRVASCALLSVAIASGIAFRFYHLGIHGFGGDEGVAAIHVAGYSGSDVRAALSGAAPVSATSLAAFRTVSVRGPSDTIRALATEDSQHPPAYYVLAQGWERLFGSGAIKLRLFSALLSLLLLPAVFWLCFELFDSRTVAWVATAISAISPLNVEYAQQAREYGAWMILTVTASAVLLRALKSGNARWWIAYAAVTALALYTHIFYGLVVLAHLAYMLGLTVRGERRGLIRFFVAVGIGIAAASPWYALLAMQHFFGGEPRGFFAEPAFAVRPQNFNGALYAWLQALGAPFVDLEAVNVAFFAVVLAIIAVEAFAVVSMIRRATFAQWWFIVTLGSPLVLLQVGNTGLTNMPRYMIPTMIALQIAVAWMIGTAYDAGPSSRRPAIVAASAALALLLFIDCAVRANASVWWSDPTDLYWQPVPPIAARIKSSSADAVVMSAPSDWEALSDVASLLPGTDRIWLATDENRWRSALSGEDDVYLLSTRGEDSSPRGLVLQAVPVEYPALGYNLLQAVRGKGNRLVTVTRLWRVSPSPPSRR
jgi:uncharacterized membrane protein